MPPSESILQHTHEKSVDARKNFWHTENLMWKQGLAGRLWESAAAVVNSMPIYCQKKKGGGEKKKG